MKQLNEVSAVWKEYADETTQKKKEALSES